MKTKQKNYPIPLRMKKSLRDRIHKAANRIGASRSAIVRLALLNQLPQIESGVIRLVEIDEEKN